jgi:2-methylcitrate dehydratase PrpD
MSEIGDHHTKQLTSYVSRLTYESLPAAVVEQTKLRIVDFLAAAMAGHKVNKIFNEAALDVFGGMGGKPESTVLFGAGRFPSSTAALLNAIYGHGADLDDGHRTANGHPGVVTVPTALALAEANKISGRAIIPAIVAGYDVYVRLSNAVMPSHFLRGFHGTGTVGAVAAGAAAAKTLGLSEEGVRRSISLAAIQASGLFEVSESGQMAKPINPGNAARTGIISALLARAGSDAPQEPFAGKKGFFKAFADEVNLDPLLKDLGSDYKLMTCYLKLYPACRHTHAPIDVALKLRAKGISPLEKIAKIKIYTYPAAILVTGNIAEPVSEDGAKFSMTYATATAMLSGNYTLEDLEAARTMSDETRALIRKMEIVSDPSQEDRTANIRGCKIEIITKDGTVRTASVILPKGDPEVPVDAHDMREKLRSCAKGLFAEKVQGEIFECAMRLDKLDDIGELLRLLA